MQRIELLYRMCQWLRCDPQREGYKLHSLLCSVGKRAEPNFNFPAPPSSHISGICKNLADTWPAATRVLSRGRKREDPGNEVDLSSRRVVFSTRCVNSSSLRLSFVVSLCQHSSPPHFNSSSRRLVVSSAAILNTEKTLGKKQTAQVQVPTCDSTAILQDGRAIKCNERHSQGHAFTYRSNSSGCLENPNSE